MRTRQTSKRHKGEELRLPASLKSAPAASQDGAIAIYVALMLPFLVGLALLVVDGGRLFNLDTSLQNNVDALALAGAAELDRRPDAHVRTCRAMQNLVSNKQLFVTSNDQLDVACDSNGNPTSSSDVSWCWLKSLPADHCKIDLTDSCQKNSTTPGSDCAYDVSNSPETSYFLQVKSRVQAADFTTLMPLAFVRGNSASGVRRSAVAGMMRAVCQPTPLMICNPWESQGIDTVAELRTKIGSMTTAREYGGGGAAIGPGEFGLLDPGEVIDTCTNSGGIVQTLTWQLAGGGQGACKVQNGLCPKTGVVAKLDDAVNSRFDIYKGAIGSYLNQDPTALVPAARTIWNAADRSAAGCQTTSQHELNGIADGIWYPRDQNWSRVTYFAQAHPELSGFNTTSSMVTLPDGRQKQLGSLTRYETYQWEAAQAAVSTAATPPFTYTKPVASTCFASKVNNGATILSQLGLNGRLARRDLYGAVANCLEIQAAIDAGAAYSLHGSSTTLPLPSLAVAKFFITEPVNRTHEQTLSVGQSGTSGNSATAWPQSTCPLAAGHYSFEVDIGSNLQAGKTYYLQRPNQLTIEATLSDDDTPTMTSLKTAFESAASELGLGSAYQFCTKSGSTHLFIGTIETSNKNELTFGLSVLGASKRIFLELVDVYAADNGGNVTRDIVRLYR